MDGGVTLTGGRQRVQRGPKGRRNEDFVVVGLQIPERLKTILTILGREQKRTLSAEIRARLEASLAGEPLVIGDYRPRPAEGPPPRRSIWRRLAASLTGIR